MIYIIIFLVLAVFAFIDLVSTPKKVKVIVGSTLVLGLIIIAGLRWEVGPDWDSYETFFNDYELYRDGKYINMLEPGYTMLNGFIKMFSQRYTVFLFFIAVITIGLKYLVFLRHAKILFVLMFFYYSYYLADIASVRQFTALSLTLLSSVFIVKRWPILFILTVLLATSIHISSVAFFAAYWLYHVKFTNRVLGISLLLAFVIGFLNISGLLLEKMINMLGPASIYAEKLLKYNESGVESSTGNAYFNFVLGAVKRAVIIPALFYVKNRVAEEDRDVYRGYLNLLVMGNIIYFLFIISFPEVTRLSVSYLYFEIFLLSFSVVSIKDLKLRLVVFGILIIFAAFRLYSFMSPFMAYYLPFKTILS